MKPSKLNKLTRLLIIFGVITVIHFAKTRIVEAADMCTCECYECESGPCCIWCTSETNCADFNTYHCEWCFQCTECGCFTGETEITVKEMGGAEETEAIENLEAGDIVSSFDPETGEIKESTVSDITKTTRKGYYILETESGKKVKVTAEHPFLAIKAEDNQKSNSDFQTTLNKLEEIFSHTLTYRLITNIQTKLREIF